MERGRRGERRGEEERGEGRMERGEGRGEKGGRKKKGSVTHAMGFETVVRP